jgi:hypothetical protein
LGNSNGIGSLSSALARHRIARTVNVFMTATYWEVGRRIVEFAQGGEKRAEYGEELLDRLAADLNSRFGRGFSRRNLQSMRQFYSFIPTEQIWQTLSAKSSFGEIRATPPLESGEPQIAQTLSAKSADAILSAPSSISETPQIMQTPPAQFNLADLARAFPLPWSHYVLLISRSRSPEAFGFYHAEALRGGWSGRQLQRQIDSQFYERTAL